MNFKKTNCKLFKDISIDTWNRISFSRNRKGFKIFETTITQNLIFNILSHNEINPINDIKIYEAIDEPNNGNDIELVIRTKNGYVLCPTQAKIIYQNDKYQSIDHKKQIDLLLDYAKSIQGLPFYLFYNYIDIKKMGLRFGYNNNVIKENYGCTLVNANYLFNNFAYSKINKKGNASWTVPNFFDLHPKNCFSLINLSCCNFSNIDLSDLMKLFKTRYPDVQLEYDLRTYSLKEIILDGAWKEMNLNSEVTIFKSKHSIIEKKYHPTFRLIL